MGIVSRDITVALLWCVEQQYHVHVHTKEPIMSLVEHIASLRNFFFCIHSFPPGYQDSRQQQQSAVTSFSLFCFFKSHIMSDAARWKATVFVGGLSQVVTDKHLYDAFIPFGEIVEVQLPKADGRKSATDSHRGFAYVEFEDADDALEAVDNMDQSEFFGKILKVSQAKAPKSADEGLGSKKAVWEQVCRYRSVMLQNTK